MQGAPRQWPRVPPAHSRRTPPSLETELDLQNYILSPSYQVDSNLSLIQEFYEPDELDHLESVQLHRAHLKNFDLTQRIEPPEGACKRFPSIRLLPLNQLLRAIKSTRDPQNGETWPPGSREFGKKLSKTEKLINRADEAISLHFERIYALNHCLLAIQQEDVGIADEKLLIKLRYFPAALALKAMEIDPFQNRTWSKGLERPTPECTTLVIRGEAADSYHFALFNLTA